MTRIFPPLGLLLVLTAGALAYFIYFGQWFPPTMAVHFNAAGFADGWADRIKFIVIGSSVSFMLPPFMVALLGVLPRIIPVSMLNLPNKDYWFTPERRDEGYRRVMVLALWFGCVLQAFLLGLWILIGQANAAPQPHLTGHWFLLIGLLGGLALHLSMARRSLARPE